MNIGERIKETRKKRGKTLLEVADHLGVTEATAQRYESGNIKNLKLDTITKISNFLNVNPAFLMGWTKTGEKETYSKYKSFPTPISAGLPNNVDGITDADEISLPDSVMGKWAGNKDIFITKINGDSMNKVAPDGSLIAVKPISLDQLKSGDMVVFSKDGEYSVKFYKYKADELVFQPCSFNKDDFFDLRYRFDENVQIHGKVVVYMAEMD